MCIAAATETGNLSITSLKGEARMKGMEQKKSDKKKPLKTPKEKKAEKAAKKAARN